MTVKTVIVLYVAFCAAFFCAAASASYYEDISEYEDSDYETVNYYPAYTDPTRIETEREFYHKPRNISGYANYSSRLPRYIAPSNERMIVVDPKTHVWGAYTADGKLIRAGLATAGGKWCSDINRPCRTKAGVFRIQSLGDASCVSKIYPVGQGGAPMPYCMFFNGGQGIHGSNHLAEANVSHGCVRISVDDARWLRYNFARIGTKIVIKSY